MIKNATLFFLMIGLIQPAMFAQSVDTTALQVAHDSGYKSVAVDTMQPHQRIARPSFLVPAFMIVYGLTTFKSDLLQDLNEDIKKVAWTDNTHSQLHIDNYLQFAPAVAVYALNIAGIRGKNNFCDRSLVLVMSNIFLNVTVGSVKKLTREQRPDGSSYASFPSGHTAEAFANAEFLRQEYKDVSAWYGIAGYAAATATGMLRIYNNRHWLSDIISGAGVGIASTRLAYLLYPAISKKLFPKNNFNGFVVPTYQNKLAGIAMVYHLP